MHTAEELDASDFEYRTDERVVSREAVMPAIEVEDRLGLVVGTGTDGLCAGNFVLSCVTAFYDRLRETTDEFFEYPDYYTFQTTDRPADYGMLDVYPDHKNVRVAPDDESLLRAVNDRAIDVLLVPDGRPEPPDVDDVTRRSAERRIDRCFAYGTDVRPDDGAFTIRLPREPTVSWYEQTARSVEAASPTDPLPSFGAEGDHVVQRFRPLSLQEALSRLPSE